MINFAMANQLRQRGGRGTSLGLLSGRLCGGFTASVIPRSSSSDAASSSSANSPTPSLTESFSGLQDPCSTGTDVMRVILETVKKMDRKITSLEQQQTKVTDSVKELTALIKSQERANFSIKGSAWEVRNFCGICACNSSTLLGSTPRTSSKTLL